MLKLLENIMLESKNGMIVIPEGTSVQEYPRPEDTIEVDPKDLESDEQPQFEVKQLVKILKSRINKIKSKMRGEAASRTIQWMERLIDLIKIGNKEQILKDREHIKTRIDQPGMKLVQKTYNEVGKHLGVYQIDKGVISQEGYQQIRKTIFEAIKKLSTLFG